MHLADHIRPLLRDHDCVIIPDFGGLVADTAPARLQPGRQVLSPPTKLVAFNQALTRNDGLLVDALAQYQEISIAQAREVVRQAVARLQQDLQETNRTELPGIGIFRQAAGRGLSFEYTGSDNLLPASFGLPEVVARPVLATNARLAREKAAQPVLRSGTARRGKMARLLPGLAVAVVATLLVSANYLMALRGGQVPAQWQLGLSSWFQPKAASSVASAPAYLLEKPQQATLAQPAWSDNGEAATAKAPAELPAPATSPASTAEAVDENSAPATGAAEDAWDTNVEAPEVAAVKLEEPAAKPLADKAVKAKVAKPAVAGSNAAAPSASAAAPASTTIKSQTGRFYVIAGAFRTLASAEKVRKAQKGGSARVLLPPPGSRLFRLSVADFADKAAAENEARRLRTKAHSTNSHLVLNY
ncbi:hypothetical protein GCM10023185_21530 [Hymenobacter saemangeumensis]|uniref:SPOR domain-containing protein n=1 Tax=Hymenobacter saemangeumensis TaxID=1084522 RepID=A0ABP8IE65_9BACT